jgi:hypothetical protein
MWRRTFTRIATVGLRRVGLRPGDEISDSPDLLRNPYQFGGSSAEFRHYLPLPDVGNFRTASARFQPASDRRKRGDGGIVARRIIGAAECLAVSIVAGLGLTGHAHAEAFKQKAAKSPLCRRPSRTPRRRTVRRCSRFQAFEPDAGSGFIARGPCAGETRAGVLSGLRTVRSACLRRSLACPTRLFAKRCDRALLAVVFARSAAGTKGNAGESSTAIRVSVRSRIPS